MRFRRTAAHALIASQGSIREALAVTWSSQMVNASLAVPIGSHLTFTTSDLLKTTDDQVSTSRPAIDRSRDRRAVSSELMTTASDLMTIRSYLPAITCPDATPPEPAMTATRPREAIS